MFGCAVGEESLASGSGGLWPMDLFVFWCFFLPVSCFYLACPRCVTLKLHNSTLARGCISIPMLSGHGPHVPARVLSQLSALRTDVHRPSPIAHGGFFTMLSWLRGGRSGSIGICIVCHHLPRCIHLSHRRICTITTLLTAIPALHMSHTTYLIIPPPVDILRHTSALALPIPCLPACLSLHHRLAC